MTINEILEALANSTGRFPREAVKAAIAHQEEITPHLLRIVEDTTSRIKESEYEQEEEEEEGDPYMASLFAFYLLAQFREERAYPPIVELFSIPGDRTLDVMDDFVTEGLSRVLASVSGGDIGPMQDLVENPALNEYVRSAALEGILCLTARGVIDREETIAYFHRLYHGALGPEPFFMWSSLAACSTNLYPEELMPEIREAFRKERIDRFFIAPDSVEDTLAEGKEATLTRLQENRYYQMIDDTVAEMEWWACFRESSPPAAPPTSSTTFVRATERVGRNDPCPCGSGRKYKHCCGRPGGSGQR